MQKLNTDVLNLIHYYSTLSLTNVDALTRTVCMRTTKVVSGTDNYNIIAVNNLIALARLDYAKNIIDIYMLNDIQTQVLALTDKLVTA